MEKEKLHILLEKYLKGKCSPEEEQELMNWYASFEQRENFTDSLNERDQHRLGQSMRRAIAQNITKPDKPTPRTKIIRWPRFILTTAAALVLITVGWVYYLTLSQEVTYQTAYGEIKTITLPDQSVATLNGHSVLRIKEQWSWWADREVWLEGEAFFSVTHQQNNQHFVVHTPGQVSVEVLGTEFNVSQRSSGTNIALASGSISLHIGKPLDKNQVAAVPMEPGEVVTLSPNHESYKKHKVKNIEAYYAWKKQKLLLNRTSLEELLTSLQETHGLKLKVTERKLLDRKASGTLPLSRSAGQLMRNLAALYDLVPVAENDYTILSDGARQQE